jgi:TolB-like protein
VADVFLSYSREDQLTTRRFAEGLESEGFSVWWDATLKVGQAYDEVTERALNEAKAVVVLWSKTSVASRWVRAEATQANDSKTLVPVMIEPCKRPIMFELTHTADLSHWKGDRADKAWQSFIAGVREFVDRDAVRPAASSVPLANAVPQVRRRLGAFPVALLIAAVLIAAGVALWILGRTVDRAPATAGTPKSPVAAAQAIVPEAAGKGVTLAVLPFADLSPARDQENFSDGLTEEILNALAHIKDLAVTGRTSSFSFKGQNEDLRAIGEKLGVANLLEGSIRKDGKSLRITAQLINSATGAHLWSETYDRPMSGIFVVQEEIAKDVAKALSVTLDVGDLPRAQGGTRNIEAYEKFLQAEALVDSAVGLGRTEHVALFRAAVALDPRFARAWYGLFNALKLTLLIPDPLTAATTRKEMQEISARMVELAPDAWFTQAALADQARRNWRWAESEAAVTKALAAAPGADLRMTNAYVQFLKSVGRDRDSAAYMRRVHSSNPLSLVSSLLLQISLDKAGRHDEAQDEYERTRKLGLDYGILDWFALMRNWSRKDVTVATRRAQWRALNSKHDRGPLPLDVILAEKFEDTAAARAAVRHAYAESIKDKLPAPSGISFYVNLFDDKELALTLMRRELLEVGTDYTYLQWEANPAGVRADPRFKALLRDLGLVDYFRSSGNWGDYCRPVGADDFECQ